MSPVGVVFIPSTHRGDMKCMLMVCARGVYALRVQIWGHWAYTGAHTQGKHIGCMLHLCSVFAYDTLIVCMENAHRVYNNNK